MRRIGITGGIGSGKSVVSRLLRIMGYRYHQDQGTPQGPEAAGKAGERTHCAQDQSAAAVFPPDRRHQPSQRQGRARTAHRQNGVQPAGADGGRGTVGGGFLY